MAATTRRAPRSGGRWWALGLVLSLALAAVVGHYASDDPDGLERVAEDKGFIHAAQDHALAGSPLADYGVRGVDHERLSVGLAGAAGVVVTLVAGGGLLWLVRRPDDEPDALDGPR